ncbi:hypothetical protein Tco_1460388 [Tanacetum coccineum]
MVVEEEVKDAVMASCIWRWNAKSRSKSAVMADWQSILCAMFLHDALDWRPKLWLTHVDDLETTSYFLDDQEIRHGPRRKADPETDLLLIGQAANHCHNRQNGKGCCLLENANLVLDQV